MRKKALLLLLSLNLGCAAHRSKGLVDMTVPRALLTADPVLQGCNPNLDPPKCKSVKLTFVKGAPQIHLP